MHEHLKRPSLREVGLQLFGEAGGEQRASQLTVLLLRWVVSVLLHVAQQHRPARNVVQAGGGHARRAITRTTRRRATGLLTRLLESNESGNSLFMKEHRVLKLRKLHRDEMALEALANLMLALLKVGVRRPVQPIKLGVLPAGGHLVSHAEVLKPRDLVLVGRPARGHGCELSKERRRCSRRGQSGRLPPCSRERAAAW